MYRFVSSLAVALVALVGCGGGAATPSARGSGAQSGPNAGLGTPAANGAGPGTSSGNNVGGPIATLPGLGSAGSRAPSSDPNVCASAQVSASRITPDVFFVIDGSGSMNARFGSGTRWSVLREALVGQTGVITQLQGSVRFGMAIYSSTDPMMCPTMSQVPSALMNLMPLTAAYPAQETGGGTPTGEALQKVVDGLQDFNVGPDSTDRPPIIILATDGEPNGCGVGGAATCNWAGDLANCLTGVLNQVAAAPANYDTTLAAVRAAKAKNIPVWVVSLADGLNAIPDLQKTANIGAGLADDAMPAAPIYSPTNPDELTQTLGQLIGAATSCDITLAGKLDVTRACEGTVKMNGTALTCNDGEGWKAIDSGHITLQGSACTRFKADASVALDARFPCDVVVLN